MYKFLIIALALIVLYKLITNDRSRKGQDESKIREKKIAKGELVKDPSCGTYVDPETSISVRDGDTRHCFCSYDCRDKFLHKLEESGRAIPSKESDDEE